MTLNLPTEVAEACAPLFEAIPFEKSMLQLVGFDAKQVALVEKIVSLPAISSKPSLIPGLWLYVDEFAKGHDFIQDLTDDDSSFWHGIMHRREGDFSNSHYWMHRASAHPLFQSIDPDRLVNDVSKDGGANSPPLLERQRGEWKTLFEWCANR